MNCSVTVIGNIVFQYRAFAGSSKQTYRLNANASQLLCPEPTAVQIRINFNTEFVVLKTYTKLMKSKALTYMRVDQGAFVMAAVPNQVQTIPDGSAILVSNYVAQKTPPQLVAYTLSSAYVLTLFFTAPMTKAQMNPTQFTFQSSPTPATNTWTLTTGSTVLTSTNFNQTVTLFISADVATANQLTSNQVYKTQASTWLSMQSLRVVNGVNVSAAYDTFGNPVVGISPGKAMQVGPTIQYWYLDMNTGTVTLTFTEPVNGSFTPVGLTIQNNASRPTYSVNLTTGGVVTPADSAGYMYSFRLTRFELNRVKLGGYNTGLLGKVGAEH